MVLAGEVGKALQKYDDYEIKDSSMFYISLLFILYLVTLLLIIITCISQKINIFFFIASIVVSAVFLIVSVVMTVSMLLNNVVKDYQRQRSFFAINGSDQSQIGRIEVCAKALGDCSGVGFKDVYDHIKYNLVSHNAICNNRVMNNKWLNFIVFGDNGNDKPFHYKYIGARIYVCDENINLSLLNGFLRTFSIVTKLIKDKLDSSSKYYCDQHCVVDGELDVEFYLYRNTNKIFGREYESLFLVMTGDINERTCKLLCSTMRQVNHSFYASKTLSAIFLNSTSATSFDITSVPLHKICDEEIKVGIFRRLMSRCFF